MFKNAQDASTAISGNMFHISHIWFIFIFLNNVFIMFTSNSFYTENSSRPTNIIIPAQRVNHKCATENLSPMFHIQNVKHEPAGRKVLKTFFLHYEMDLESISLVR